MTMYGSELDENTIRDIGHAFGYYDYGAEHGLIDAFPSRDAAAAFICGYVRMALQSGMLYATSENGEGYIAYKLPGQRVGLKAALPLAKGFLGSMKARELVRFMRIMSRGGSGLAGAVIGILQIGMLTGVSSELVWIVIGGFLNFAAGLPLYFSFKKGIFYGVK